jgi:DNA-binding CsgD family transcriptional regulator
MDDPTFERVKKVPITPSASGFLLLDASLNLIASNPEAVNILSYPSKPEQIKHLNAFLSDRIRTALVSHQSPKSTDFVKEYQSSRRRYVCRKIQLDCDGRTIPQPAIAVILERNATPSLALEDMCKQFDLTPRERETVELLVQGLTSKEIAVRMAISANTVKAFVRLVMVKLGVTTRSGIVGRLAGTHNTIRSTRTNGGSPIRPDASSFYSDQECA